MRLPLLLVLMSICLTSSSQTSINDVLNTMPKELIQSLNDEQRADLLLDTSSNDTIKIKNMLNGTTSIDSLDVDYAKISTSKVSDIQIRLLPCDDSSKIICLVKTIKEPVRESIVSFYSDDWTSLETNFDLPDIDDPDSIFASFVQRPDTMSEESFNDLCKYIEPVVFCADFSNKDILVYDLSVPPTSNDKTDELKAVIRKNRFKWNGSNFKKY